MDYDDITFSNSIMSLVNEVTDYLQIFHLACPLHQNALKQVQLLFMQPKMRNPIYITIVKMQLMHEQPTALSVDCAAAEPMLNKYKQYANSVLRSNYVRDRWNLALFFDGSEIA